MNLYINKEIFLLGGFIGLGILLLLIIRKINYKLTVKKQLKEAREKGLICDYDITDLYPSLIITKDDSEDVDEDCHSEK